MELQVVIGDLGTTDADALITLVNSGGMWFGAIDGIIQRHGTFHHAINGDMSEGATHVAESETYSRHGACPWERIIFVIDDLRLPLADLVEAGLERADALGCKTVVIPAMRMGVMLNAGPEGEQSLESKCRAIVEGVGRQPYQHIQEVKLVVYGGDANKDKIFPLCQSSAAGLEPHWGRELRCIQL